MGEIFCCVKYSENGCLLIGVSSFIMSLAAASTSCALLFLYHNCLPCAAHLEDYPDMVLEIMIPSAIVLGTLFMAFSLLLIIGVKKNRPSFVLSYFTFSTLLTIVWLLGALLVLLEGLFLTSLTMLTISLVNMYCLVVVHATYDTMQIRNGLYQRQSDQHVLIDSDEEL